MPRGISRRHHDVDRRQLMLVQAKRFARETLDAVARDGRAECAGRHRETKARANFMVCNNRQTEIDIAQAPAALPNGAKFGRLVQPLARLEPQPLA
jgi:hypothetical protein